MTSKAPKLLKINAVLFLLAIAVSSYMVWQHYDVVNGAAGFTSFCTISAKVDCQKVNGSAYSEIAGVPLATLGLTYYLFGLLLSLIGARSTFSRREALLTLAPLSILSVVASFGTLAISIVVLKTVCIMCMSMQALSLATCILTLICLRELTAKKGVGHEAGQADRKKIGTYLGLGVAVFAVTFGLTSQLRIDAYPLPDPEKFINDFRAQPVKVIDAGDSPRQGFQGDNPPLRLIEFADFQCPACGFAARQMHHLVEQYADKIQLVFKNFPLDPTCNSFIHNKVHQYACLAAKTAYCAKKQGKFQPMYEKLFGNQTDINPENILMWEGEIGLDLKMADACIADPATEAALKPDMELAQKVGLQSTPTFFVGGRMVNGPIDETRLKLLMREMGI